MSDFYPRVPDRCRYWHYNGEAWLRCRALVSQHDSTHAEWHKQLGDHNGNPTITTERTV